MPKVSVLIPIYNCVSYIEEAIQSVLNQTYQDFELIIVDNCSTDGSYELIQTFSSNPKIRIYQNPTNIGMARNWNQCLMYASGEYIKFLCADDYFLPNLLEVYLSIFESDSNISLVFSPRKFLYTDGSFKTLKPLYAGKIDGKVLCKDIIKSDYLNPIGEPTIVMFKRKDLNIGFFNTDMHWLTDIDFWLRLCQLGDVYGLSEAYSIFRQSEQQGTVEVIKSGKGLFEERNFIFYNHYIRPSIIKDDNVSYSTKLKKHFWSNIGGITVETAVQYLNGIAGPIYTNIKRGLSYYSIKQKLNKKIK